MRPRRVCRGIPPPPHAAGRPRRRFNEAPACLPGNRYRETAGRSRRRRFNEAPACLPGNRHRGGLRAARRRASMRPRRVCRGIQRRLIWTRLSSRCFNEAPACLPGNPLRRSREWSSSAQRFNEAPACLPGNRFRRAHRGRQERLASMRPRRVCRGIPPCATSSTRSSTWCFNEAPACLPGNPITAMSAAAWACALQ